MYSVLTLENSDTYGYQEFHIQTEAIEYFKISF